MKLTITITHYNEPWEVCKPLFDSIALQQGIDFGDIQILLVQDGNQGVLERSAIEAYKLPVEFIMRPKTGVSAARNSVFAWGKGEYVMFCDCDDMFCNMFGLHLLLSGIQDKPDIVSSKFVEENKVVAPYKLIGHDNDMTFVHGKIFRRDFLLENKLRFHEDLTRHEDSPFVFLAHQLTTNIKYINTPFYVWKWNPNSVMRSYGVGKALLYTYPDLMKTKETVINDMQSYGLETKKFAAKFMLDTYYDFNRDEFTKAENDEYINNALHAAKRFWLKVKDLYFQNTAAELGEYMMIARSVAYNGGMLAERMTLPQFLALLGKL